MQKVAHWTHLTKGCAVAQCQLGVWRWGVACAQRSALAQASHRSGCYTIGYLTSVCPLVATMLIVAGAQRSASIQASVCALEQNCLHLRMASRLLGGFILLVNLCLGRSCHVCLVVFRRICSLLLLRLVGRVGQLYLHCCFSSLSLVLSWFPWQCWAFRLWRRGDVSLYLSLSLPLFLLRSYAPGGVCLALSLGSLGSPGVR